MSLRVVHTVGSLSGAHGGPSRSVTLLADALAGVGAAVEIVAMQEPGERPVRPADSRVALRLVPGHERDGAWRARATPFGRALVDAVTGCGETTAVVHDHGLWLPTNRTASRVAQAAGVPLVVSPKGMLSARALGAARAKKRVAWMLYQRLALTRARAFAVTSPTEADDVRRAGLGQPVAVIGYGVAVPTLAPRAAAPDGVRTALFLSRVHPIKGLPDLVEAWAAVRPGDWRLVVAGPGDAAYVSEVQAQVRAHGLSDRVSFVGEVSDADKGALYGAADLFVLPSHSENFGIVVAEALAAGVPVVTTRATPWAPLVEHGCGWWVETGAASVGRALAEATAAPPDRLAAMGARGRAYAEAHLSWEASAREHLALYLWLVGQGERPASVIAS